MLKKLVSGLLTVSLTLAFVGVADAEIGRAHV